LGKSYHPVRKDDDDLEGPFIWDTVLRLIRDHHKHFAAEGVTLQILQARAYEGAPPMLVPAIFEAKVPIASTVSVTSTINRILGTADAYITLDAFAWSRMSDQNKRACLDHQLCALDIVLGSEGEVQTDCAGRPKLTIRPPDFRVSGFKDVVARHGNDSIERIQVEHMARVLGQMSFQFMMIDPETEVGRQLFTERLQQEEMEAQAVANTISDTERAALGNVDKLFVKD
jgi:hypothetical protein